MQKIPIERIRHRLQGHTKRRTQRACDLCRKRKTKCDGRKPTCAQCDGLGMSECVYSEGKASQDRRRLESAISTIKVYKELLQDISHTVDTPTSLRITNTIKRHSSTDSGRDRRAPSASSSSVGSLDGIGTVSEDLNRNEESRATGYMGKNSEVAWLQRLNLETANQRGSEHPSHDPLSRRSSIASLSYHLDRSRIAGPQESDAYTLPPKAVADRLLQSYFDNVHCSFPVIRQNLFLPQYHRLFQNPSLRPGKKWLAVFNMVLAISSQFGQLSGQGLQDETSADVFFTRARTLNISENIIYEHDDLQQLQAEILLAFYFLSTSQVNRSWKMVGIAARAGIALGLNLRQINNDLDIEANETRKLLWWSIFYLEHLLSVMTGRVSCLTIESTSAPPPLPFELSGHGSPDVGRPDHGIASAQSMQWSVSRDYDGVKSQQEWLKPLAPNRKLYFYYLLDLAVITHAITNQVYTPGVSQGEPHQIEKRIKFLGRKLDLWLSGLNPSLAFEDQNAKLFSNGKSRYQISLALSYYSTRVLLHRPCLTRPVASQDSGLRVPRSRFRDESAFACLQASMTLIDVLPEQPDVSWISTIAPWWSLVHFLMQVTIVLLSHLSIYSIPAQADKTKAELCTADFVVPPETVFNTSKKALRWLHSLGNTDPSAHKAFELCYICIRRIASSKGLDLSDVPPLAETSIASEHPERSSARYKTKPDSEQGEASAGLPYFATDQDGDLLLRELMKGSSSSYLFPTHDGYMDMETFTLSPGLEHAGGTDDVGLSGSQG